MDSSSSHEDSTSTSTTNWKLCCLCQHNTSEKLLDATSSGYLTLASNIPQFYKMNCMPILLDPKRLDDGDGIQSTLEKNKATYHNSCKLKFKTSKLERKRKSLSTPEEKCEVSSAKFTRSSINKTCTEVDSEKKGECFICNQTDTTMNLRQAMTLQLHNKLKKCAENLLDDNLLAKLSVGDVISQEYMYHAICLTKVYNRERARLSSQNKDSNEAKLKEEAYAYAFAELEIFIREKHMKTEGSCYFRLLDLYNLYTSRLEKMNVDASSVNRTRLKEQIVARIPELEPYNKGKEIWFAYKQNVGAALATAFDQTDVVKTAMIIRKQMLEHKCGFTGNLTQESQKEAVPSSLLEFVSVLQNGGNIESQLECDVTQANVALAQLLQYNCRKSQTSSHSKSREPPFPVYIGLLVYAKTRKRHLIELLHQNGLSISYDRVIEITKDLGTAVVNRAEEEEVVCPTLLRKGLFTTCAVDNLDHNPSSTTAKSSFHGTGMSLFQHPSPDSRGEDRILPQTQRSGTKSKKVPSLPEYYTNVPPASFGQSNPVPVSSESVGHSQLVLPNHLCLEYQWLQKVCLSMDTEEAVSLSWPAHHASMERNPHFEISLSAMMPLFPESAHSVAMIKHAMDLVKATTTFLNPGQVPVMAVDQPLFAIAKQVQWKWPDLYGDMVIMFGGLHLEMCALKMLGEILKDSGWTMALTEAEVASAGTADSFISASHVKRTRIAHQVTACSLYQLCKTAYDKYLQEAEDADVESFEQWISRRESESPQFHFWNLVLRLELLVLLFIRSYRESNFELYKDVLQELLPFFFALDHIHYARWISVHLRDMETLDGSIYAQFAQGKFTVHKTARPFSSIAIDQAHEQNNAHVKGDGGAIGLLEDESALRRWTVAGPEVSRLIQEFENQSFETKSTTKHHEDVECMQKDFKEKVRSLKKVILEMGNPFEEDSTDLLVLDTHEIVDSNVSKSLKALETLGKKQFAEFKEQLKTPSRFYEPIRKNKVPLFSRKSKPVISKDKEKMQTMKDDYNLFSRLFISCQNRQCDLEEFFQHENQSSPPALARAGQMHQGQKSQLLPLLEAQVTSVPDREPPVDAFIIDGAALVNSLRPSNGSTFEAYAMNEVLPKLQKYANGHKQLHIVFDVYREDSLKSQTRQKRGTGVRRRVGGGTKTPTNWASFLRNDLNKTELFEFLAHKIASMDTQNKSCIIVTMGNAVLCNLDDQDVSDLQGCTHEEADTRMFLHAGYAAKHDVSDAIICSSDTDVVVIAVSLFQRLGLKTLWIDFGRGKDHRWIPIHEIASAMGTKSSGLCFFHAFSGCDTVSSFHGKGKKSAWHTWNVFEKISPVFTKLSSSPAAVTDEDMQVIEEFVVLMYDRSSSYKEVNEARLDLFARKQRSYDSIPPTSAALKEHCKRAAFQAGHIWGQSLLCSPILPSPSHWGWHQKDRTWLPHWTDLPAVAKSCQELTRCGCKKECSGRCKCFKSGLTCTPLCGCSC